MKVRITFTEPLLGTISGNREITEEFIASKHPDGQNAEEVEAVPLDETMEKASTIFARDPEGRPMMYDYHWKGYFKEACDAMIHTETMTKEELKKYRLTEYLFRKTIDRQIFVTPRRIPLQLPEGARISFLERPLRGQTMRGERIALARSEQSPVGTSIEFEIVCMNAKLPEFVTKWLDAGALLGTGQWRSGGYGRFMWEIISE